MGRSAYRCRGMPVGSAYRVALADICLPIGMGMSLGMVVGRAVSLHTLAYRKV